MDWTPLVASLPQGGSIVAFIIVVVLFLNHIKTKDDQTTMLLKQAQETHLNCEEKLESIADKCLIVVQDNTKALIELKEAVRELKLKHVS